MMDRDKFIEATAALIAGLQVARSISTAPFGAALEPYDQLLHNVGPGFGWTNKEELARRIRLILDQSAAEPAGCRAEVRHGPGHQSVTLCELTGPHDVHRAIYGSQRQEATWQGPHVYTGVFDEPPTGES